MKILKLLHKWQVSLLECSLKQINKYGSVERCYSGKADKKEEKTIKGHGDDSDDGCSGDMRTKHKLVPCKESDTVAMCIKELIQFKSDDKLPARSDQCYRVIIIGAGIAGLTAAARMISSNLTDFVVLEAKNRPGGRVKTAKFGNTLIDLGGEFIEGASIVNPVYQFACLNNLITEASPKVQTDTGIFLLSDSRAIEGSEKVFSAFNKIMQNVAVEVEDENYGRCNVFEYIEEKMKKEVDNYPEWEQDNAMRMVYSLMNDLRVKIGTDMSLTNVKVFGSCVSLPGPRMRFDEGGASYIEALLKKIPKDKVILNKGVQTIFWKTEPGSGDSENIKVRCCDGSEFQAQHVIVTVSLGALRCLNTLFSPSLPCDKMRAIHGIPFGKGAKLFLRYEAPFWLDKRFVLRFGWTKQELSDRQDWIKGIGSIEQVPSTTDHILKITVAGREAQIMEQNKHGATSEFIDWLDNLAGTPLSACIPIEAVATAWSNDIFTAGSNSYIAPCFQKVLAEPLPFVDDPRLIFAGEATEPGFIGSMHTAAKSGLRVADMLLSVLKVCDEKFEEINRIKSIEESDPAESQIIETDAPCPHNHIMRKPQSC